MGLDMYLRRKVYVGLNYSHNIDETKETKIVINGKHFDHSRLTELEFDVLSWRKANSIHDFFVKEVQDGEDDCREYYVDRSIIKKLVEYCTKDIQYIKSLPEEDFKSGKVDIEKLNLTPTEGFFFGSTAIDEWYLEDLIETALKLNVELLNEEGDFYYQSSW